MLKTEANYCQCCPDEVDFGDGRLLPVSVFHSLNLHKDAKPPKEEPLGGEFIYVHMRLQIPLYVGMTNDWRRRTRQHARKASWFPAVDEIAITEWGNLESSWLSENGAIYRFRPMFNQEYPDGRLVHPAELRKRHRALFENLDDPAKWIFEPRPTFHVKRKVNTK